MSGYEPGRPKIEEREAQYIWLGTRILLDAGVEWEITGIEPGETPDRILLSLNRPGREHAIDVPKAMLIRCRVEKEDR